MRFWVFFLVGEGAHRPIGILSSWRPCFLAPWLSAVFNTIIRLSFPWRKKGNQFYLTRSPVYEKLVVMPLILFVSISLSSSLFSLFLPFLRPSPFSQVLTKHCSTSTSPTFTVDSSKDGPAHVWKRSSRGEITPPSLSFSLSGWAKAIRFCPPIADDLTTTTRDAHLAH